MITLYESSKNVFAIFGLIMFLLIIILIIYQKWEENKD